MTLISILGLPKKDEAIGLLNDKAIAGVISMTSATIGWT